MRLRLAGLVVLAAVPAGCGHHAAAIPGLDHVPPSARIVDGHGARVLEWSGEGPHGSLWIRPDVFECSPIQPISQPYGATHPRCPA